MKTRKATTDKETSDFIEHLFPANTHDYLMFFTNTGRVYVERVHEIPDLGRASKGRSIANVLELKHGEKIADVIRVEAVYASSSPRAPARSKRRRSVTSPMCDEAASLPSRLSRAIRSLNPDSPPATTMSCWSRQKG